MTFIKGVRRITPAAAKIASREAHKHTGDTGKRRFPLDGIKDFVDAKHGESVFGKFGKGFGEDFDAFDIDGIAPESIFLEPGTHDEAICFCTKIGDI